MRQFFKWLIEKSKFIVILPVLALLISSIFLIFYGCFSTVETILKIVTGQASLDSTFVSTKFIAIMDIFLLAIILYIFSMGLYGLFIGQLRLPKWLVVEGIDQLKAKLASVIILILAVTFTKKLVLWENPLDTLLFALAISAVIAVLVLYYRIKEYQ